MFVGLVGRIEEELALWTHPPEKILEGPCDRRAGGRYEIGINDNGIDNAPRTVPLRAELGGLGAGTAPAATPRAQRRPAIDEDIAQVRAKSTNRIQGLDQGQQALALGLGREAEPLFGEKTG